MAAGTPALLPTTELTRRDTPYPAGDNIFTVADLETTGLDCDADRIVEIGMVKFTGDGTVLDEFATLVNNPGSGGRARQIHGIADADLRDAPSTADALAEAFAFMNGTVVVAHNFAFENDFLVAAAERDNIALPDVVGLCTLTTSRRQLRGRAYSLTVMHKTATGEFPARQHTALGDARSDREVLLWLLDNAPEPLHLTCAPPDHAATYPAVAACAIIARPASDATSPLADLVGSLPRSPTGRAGEPAEVRAYLAALTASVEHGRLAPDAAALADQARRTRVTGTQLASLHRRAWQAAFPDAENVAWGEHGASRRRAMRALAAALGLGELAAEIDAAAADGAETPSGAPRYLRRLRIAIVGDGDEMQQLRRRATRHGAGLAVNITGTVEWLATATPEATDAAHRAARRFGVPMLAPTAAAARLDAAIGDAERRAGLRSREDAARAARRRIHRQARDAYWRPVWRAVELDHDPELDSYWR